jgi:stage V sporulation protein R
VSVEELRSDGSLTLRHDHRADGRGLDPGRARHVLRYLDEVWRAPVRLYTADGDDSEICLTADTSTA